MEANDTPGEGKLRFRSTLIGGGIFEFFLYVKDTGYRIHPLKYSSHWQNAGGELVKRSDNAPHHSDLPYVPHHNHTGAYHV